MYSKDPTDIKIYRFASPLTSSSPTYIGKVQDVRGGLIAADFAGESLLLEQPDHFITREARTFTTIVPTVPHHIDYIRSDWRGPNFGTDRTLQLVNPPTSTVTFSKSETESSKADTTFEMKSHFEWKVGPTANFKGPIKRVGLDLGAKGSYQSASDKATNSSESNAVTRTTTIDNTPHDIDTAHSYIGTLHIWRYPIAGTYADDPNGLVKIFKDEDHGGDGPMNDPMKNVPMDIEAEKYYTIVRLADVGFDYSGVQAGDRYQPDHDESNLFSYPVSLQHDKSYNGRDRELNTENSSATNTGITFSETFDAIKSASSGEVETKSSGGSFSFTGSLTIPNGGTRSFVPGLEGGFSKLTTMSNGSSLTSTTKSTWGYKVSIAPDTSGASASVFKLIFNPYIDAGGVTNLAFAVDLRPGYGIDFNNDPAPAWDKRGPYASAPDPSLLLPYRVSVGKDKDGIRFASAEYRPREATKLRGVRIYDITAGEDPDVGTSYTVSSLVRGRTYKILVPVYNASFVDTGDFKVQLGYTTNHHLEHVMDDENRLPAADDPEVMIIEEKTMSLRGWDHNSDAHRGRVSFTWDIPEDHPLDSYELCVRILGRDGDIHRDWNYDENSPEYDPCGNDFGHYRVAVKEEKDLDQPYEITNYVTGDHYDPDTGEIIPPGKLNASASASSSAPKAELTFEPEGWEPMSLDAFRKWLEGRTDTVPTEIRVANRGDKAIIDAYIVVRDKIEEGRALNLIDADLTSIYPGKSVSFHTKIDPQRFLSRNLEVKIFGSNLNETYRGSDPVPQGTGGSGSSGGCAAGAASLVGLATLGALGTKTLRRRGK